MKQKLLYWGIIGSLSTLLGLVGLNCGNNSYPYSSTITAYAETKQTVTTDYVTQDFQAIETAIQNSSDNVKTDERLTNAYSYASSHLYTAYHAPYTYGDERREIVDWDNLGGVSIADVLHDMGKYDGLPYYINHGDVEDDLSVAVQDRSGAQYIYNRFLDRLDPANKLRVQTIWTKVQEDKKSDDIEDDLVSFFDAVNDGIVQWGENVSIKSNAEPNAVYTINNNKKAPNQFIAMYIPNGMVKKVIRKAYGEFKRNKKLIIYGNRSSYIMMNLFNTYNSGRPDSESSDIQDGTSVANQYDVNHVSRFGGKTTYKQELKFLKKAYKYRGNYGIVIKGFYYNKRRPTMRLTSWDGFVTPDNLKLQYHPIKAY